MPNRYEREIEEILRNMERTEPKQGLSDRLRAFNRPRTRTRRPSPAPSEPRVTLTRTEKLLLSGIALILVGAGVAFYFQGTSNIGGAVAGAFGLFGFLLFVVGLVTAWSDRMRGVSSVTRPTTWRNNSNNVIDITPRRRRNPFSGIVTQFRILRLKMRYRRQRPPNDE